MSWQDIYHISTIAPASDCADMHSSANDIISCNYESFDEEIGEETSESSAFLALKPAVSIAI